MAEGTRRSADGLDRENANVGTTHHQRLRHERCELTSQRTHIEFFRLPGRLGCSQLERGLAYAPYADMLWCETSGISLRRYPFDLSGKALAYNYLRH